MYFTYIPTDGPSIVEMVNATKDNFDVDDLVKFQELLLDAEKPLYEGCTDFTKLSAIVKLLNLKGNRASNSSSTELWLDKLMYLLVTKWWKKLIKPKKGMRLMGSGYKKIHVYINNCLLYLKNNKDLTACRTCGTSRWKVDNKTKNMYENILAKVCGTSLIITKTAMTFKIEKYFRDLRCTPDTEVNRWCVTITAIHAADPVTTAGEVVTTASVDISTASVPITVSTATPTTPPTTTTEDDMTLAETLMEIKSAKPKAIGVVMQEPSEIPRISVAQPQIQEKAQGSRDKGKAKMVEEEEPKEPTKRKDQIKHDEELAKRLEAQLQAEMEEEDRLARQREEEDNIVSWDNAQAMMEADYQMAERLHSEEQASLTDEQKASLFVQLLDARKKHFAALRAQEIRNKPPTKKQKRTTMCNYLKNMAGYKHNQLRHKSFADIQKLFDKALKRVNTFVPMDTEKVEGSKAKAAGSETRVEESSKRAGEEFDRESIKKQKVEDATEQAELKECFEIIPFDEDAVNTIPLATKQAPIVDYKITRDARISYYKSR
ncbi:hypothetical protein Tco_0559321 [Tanacetum coccineum]